MLYFRSQNDKIIFFPDWPDVLEKTDPGEGKPTHF